MNKNKKFKIISKKEINMVWREEWKKDINSNPKAFWGQRLFLEGYLVFKKYISEKAGQIILDIGSGTGRYGVKFAQDFPNSKVIISDILEESLVIGRKLADYLGVKNAQFQKEDVLKMSFPDNHFDVIFCDVLIQHIPNYEAAMSEMKRVLKPGGRIIVSAVNYWNPHTLYKFFLKLRGKGYEYNYEKSFKKKELRKLFEDFNLEVVGEDGFYFAYGLFRLKKYYDKFFRFLGGACNRIVTKFIDPVTNRFVSRFFGFEIFIVGEKKKDDDQYKIKVKNSGIVKLQFYNDFPDGNLVIAESLKSVPFEIKRIYFVNSLHNQEAIRGKHAHKKLEQYIFCINGKFTLSLDDGTVKQKIRLDSPYYGVRLGPELWHTMIEFSPDCVILVFAGDYYNESDYIRDYDEFLKYIKNNRNDII
ncbi:WxcM-like domain-containing protein [Candidatus Parcubacteria bacterium]|nr:WxcM-like domain-containing protein [Candidatus Parcubacteria bacterium]